MVDDRVFCKNEKIVNYYEKGYYENDIESKSCVLNYRERRGDKIYSSERNVNFDDIDHIQSDGYSHYERKCYSVCESENDICERKSQVQNKSESENGKMRVLSEKNDYDAGNYDYDYGFYKKIYFENLDESF